MNDTPTPEIPQAATRRPASKQKVPPFARFKGTSAWRKDRNRAREYAQYLASADAASSTPATPRA